MNTNINNTHHFTVDFVPQTVYATLWDLIKQFNKNCIEKVEIEIFAWTIRQEKFSWHFKHDVGPIMPYEFGNGNNLMENFFSMAREHLNKEIHFNVWYVQSYENADNTIVFPGTKSA